MALGVLTFSEDAFGSIGQIAASESVTVQVTGVSATAQTRNVTQSTNATVTATGVSATSSLGDESIIAPTVSDTDIGSVSATASVGSTTVVIGQNQSVVVSGVQAAVFLTEYHPDQDFRVIYVRVENNAYTGNQNRFRFYEDAGFTTVLAFVAGNNNSATYMGSGFSTFYQNWYTLGSQLKFDQSDPSNSGHPLAFSNRSNGTHAGGTKHFGTTQVGTPGTSGAYTRFDSEALGRFEFIAFNFQGTMNIYPYCEVHSGMGYWGSGTTSYRMVFGEVATVDGDLNNIVPVGGGSWGTNAWGDNAWGSYGSFGELVSAVGSTTVQIQQNAIFGPTTPTPLANGSIGTVTAVGKAVVDATGVSGTSGLGEETVTGVAIVDATGVSATSSIGDTTETGVANVSVTGISGTSGLGEETAVGKAVVDATGVSATGSIGDTTETGIGNVDATGVSATSSLGEEIASASVDIDVTGVSATSSLGAETSTGTASVELTGTAATSALATPTISGDANLSVTGISGTSGLGEETATAAANVSVTGVSATTSLGEESIPQTARVFISTGSWGSGGWGGDQWGGFKFALEGGVSSPTIIANANISSVDVGSVAATTAVGQTIATANADVAVTGVAGTSALGEESVTGTAVVSLTGVSATATLDDEGVVIDVTISESGLEATGGLGSVTVTADANFSVTGVSSTGTIDNGFLIRLGVTFDVTGVAATSVVDSGSVVDGVATVFPTAPPALALGVGFANIWVTITPVQNPNYQDTEFDADFWTETVPIEATSWVDVSTADESDIWTETVPDDTNTFKNVA